MKRLRTNTFCLKTLFEDFLQKVEQVQFEGVTEHPGEKKKSTDFIKQRATVKTKQDEPKCVMYRAALHEHLVKNSISQLKVSSI